LGAGLTACSQAEEKLSEELQNKVMSLHDELMPKNEEIINLQSQLDSLSKGQDSLHVNKLKKALAKSDQAMMDWMHQFSIDSLGKLDVQSKIQYLGKQYEHLQELQKLTDSTLHAAKAYRP
jgi:chromosome segregation ATPase